MSDLRTHRHEPNGLRARDENGRTVCRICGLPYDEASSPKCATDEEFHFGVKTRVGDGYCCNRPAGCSLDSTGCLWKRQKAERLGEADRG